MNHDINDPSELRTLVAFLTGLGSRVVWNDQQIQSIAMFGEDIQDKHLSDLRALTGLKELNLTRSRITDAGMFYVGKLVHLESLLLGGTIISDEGFEQLEKLTRLTSLNLIKTGVTDAGLNYFRGAIDLEALWLECTDVTDNGMPLLKSFSRLALLDLRNTALSDVGLTTIGQLSELEELSISACENVTDDGFVPLAKLKQLKQLLADSCCVSDAALQHILHLPLQLLSLNWTDVTDEGLKSIAGMHSLREVHVIGSRVSDSAAADFKTRRPDCVLHHGASRAEDASGG